MTTLSPSRVGRTCLRVGLVFGSIVTVACGRGPVSEASPPSCEALTSTVVPNATIVSAQLVAAGAFTPPAPAGAAAPEPFRDLPAFCRVAATVTPAPGADIKVEVWLPINWNGDVQPAGSGFWGGSIPYAAMREALRTGAVTAGTNLGIEGATGPSFALEHPEKLANLGNVPFHAAVDATTSLTSSYYKRSATFTYMNECGGGGSRDALAEVQRFPADLDAVAAVGFTNYGTHHGIAQMWVYQATHKTPASYIPPSKYPLIHEAAVNACDLKDGAKDGTIEDPSRCAFDPAVLRCRGGDGPTCLTAPQVEAVRTIYRTPVHSRTGQTLYGSMPPGGELGWEAMAGATPYPYTVPFYRNLVFKDPQWDYKTRPVNFAADVDAADSPQNAVINALNPDLSGFVARGGKLLLVGGWNDHTLGPGNNVHYYESVVAKMGADKMGDHVRLFMVPGMDHCFGLAYPTADTFDLDVVSTLKAWRTSGKAPDRLVVTQANVGTASRKRLVCAYPRLAIYSGTGSVDDPASFSCRQPEER